MDIHFAPVRSTSPSEGTLGVQIGGQEVVVEDNTEVIDRLGTLLKFGLLKTRERLLTQLGGHLLLLVSFGSRLAKTSILLNGIVALRYVSLSILKIQRKARRLRSTEM